MSVLLKNLVARTPNLEDMYSITELVTACDIAEHGIADSTPGMSSHLSSRWQHSGLHLETDAWVIVSGKRQFVGFGCVWHRDFEEFYMHICVHSDYRKRGIGTLLLRLVEDRARQLMRNAQPGARVSLKAVISAKNSQARSLFEREGYSLMREFWSVTMAMAESQDGRSHAGTITFDVDVEENRLVGAEQLFDREGVYSIRQFCAYEKELRPLLTVGVAIGDECDECNECNECEEYDERGGGGALACAQE